MQRIHQRFKVAQGVGKNMIVDRSWQVRTFSSSRLLCRALLSTARLLQLLQWPREYIQLHRDSTVQQLMFQTTLERGARAKKSGSEPRPHVTLPFVTTDSPGSSPMGALPLEPITTYIANSDPLSTSAAYTFPQREVSSGGWRGLRCVEMGCMK
jgi:hypothetical protein